MGTASPAINTTPSFVKPPPGFNDLYQRYSETVYRAALRVTGNAADAEDVLQTVFLRMLNNTVTLDPAWMPEPYFRRAATNASIDLLRRKNWLAEIEIDESRDYGAREDTSLLKKQASPGPRQAPAGGRGADRPLLSGGLLLRRAGGPVSGGTRNHRQPATSHPSRPPEAFEQVKEPAP